MITTKQFAVAIVLAVVCVAQMPEIPLSETRLTVHTLLREDIFSGFMANDMKRFKRGEENIDKLLELRPDQKGNLLAWKGGSLLYRAVRAHENKQREEFEKLYRQSLEALSQAVDAPGNDAVFAITGGSLGLFADRLPEQNRADAWTRAYNAYQMLWKAQGAGIERMPLHFRGELLAGLTVASMRTGRKEEAKQFADKIDVTLKDTPYAVALADWKKNPDSPKSTMVCQSCHDSRRLAPLVAALNKQ